MNDDIQGSIITPERAAKGDVLTGLPCEECGGKGRENNIPCTACRGKGWLKSVNAARVADGEIRFARAHVWNILNFLWSSETINDQQADDGMTFQAWRDMHRVAMGQQRAAGFADEPPLGVRLRAYGFVLLLKRLNPGDCRAIEKSVDVTFREYDREFIRRETPAYQRAFSHLVTIMQPVKERIAYLESLPDDQLLALEHENLKKMIAEIGKRC